MNKNSNIGFIGLGNMGKPIFDNLNKKFSNIFCFDKDKSKLIYNLCLDQEKLEKTKVHEFMELFAK